MQGHVLIVDDEEDLAAWMGEVLSGAGLDVAPVSEAPEAMSLLRNGGFDVVVSDIMMPEMDGIQLLAAVHALDPDLPVILVTGKPTLDSAIQALDLGAVQYLLEAGHGRRPGSGGRVERCACASWPRLAETPSATWPATAEPAAGDSPCRPRSTAPWEPSGWPTSPSCVPRTDPFTATRRSCAAKRNLFSGPRRCSMRPSDSVGYPSSADLCGTRWRRRSRPAPSGKRSS